MENARRKIIEFIIFSIVVSIISGIFVFQITSNISFLVSDNFYDEIIGLNNVQLENYVLKEYKEKKIESLAQLFMIANTKFDINEKYKTMTYLISDTNIKANLSPKKILSSWSFYILVLLTIGYIIFVRKYYNEIDRIDKFKDKEYCAAYIKSQGLPALMKKFKKEARSRNTTQLLDSLDSFKEVSE